MVLVDSIGVPRVPTYSGAFWSVFRFDYWTLTISGVSSQTLRLQNTFFLSLEGPTTPVYMYTGLGSSHSARRYFGNHFYFLFLQVLRCFTSLGLAFLYLCIQYRIPTS